MKNEPDNRTQRLAEGLFETLSTPATLIDTRGVIVDVNPAFVARARLRDAEMCREDRVGHFLYEFVREEERVSVCALVEALMETGEDQHLHRVVDEMGRASHRNMRGVALRDTSGRVVGGIILHEDVSQEMLQKQSVERRRQLIDAFDRIDQQVLSTLDREQILDVLSEEVVRLGLFRSLCVELVDGEQETTEIVRLCRLSDVTRIAEIKPDDEIVNFARGEGPVGLRLRIAEDALRQEIVAGGEILVIDGWDDRFDERFSSREALAERTSFFIPVKRQGEVLAILSTGCEREDKEQVLAHIAALQPLLNQVAVALYFARLHAVAQEHRDLERSEHVVRLQIASMQSSEDLVAIVAEMSAQLRGLGVEHTSCSIQIIGPEGRGFIPITVNASHWRRDSQTMFAGTEHLDNGEKYPWVEEVWRTGKTHYQPCTPADSPLLVGYSVLDAAFSRGTLAINSKEAHAFSARDIELVERFAALLSESFQRFEDLEARERTDAALHEQNELLNAIVDGTQDAIDVKDRARRRILVNPTVLRWLELTAEEVLGKRNEDLFSPELAQKLDAEDERVMESGKSEINENRGQGSWGLRHVQAHKYPLYDKNGKVRGLVGIGRDITSLRRRELLVQALAKAREKVWQMREQRDIENAIRALYQGLVDVGVPVESYAVHYIDTARVKPATHVWRYYSARGEWQSEEVLHDPGLLQQMWQRGEVTYRPDLENGEGRELFVRYCARYGHPVRSIVDMPYAHGTLAVNSSRAHAFSSADIEVLREMAAVLSEGFARREDLRTLERQGQLVRSFNRIGQQVLSTLDQERVLDILVEELMRVGVLRSLVIGLVDVEQQQIEIVRGHRVKGVHFIEEIDPHIDRELTQSPIVGHHIDLESDDLSAVAARSGQQQIVEGWDKRFDERFANRDNRRDQLAIFIPIRRGADTMAVLCTGCELADRERVLNNIEAMRPLFEQVAVALYHAQLYAALRRAREELEERVAQRTHELEMRNQDLEAFSYSVSHDLRAPLRGVAGFAQILAERYRDRLDDKGAHYLDNIVAAGQQMDRLIGDLLKYSRLGRKTIHVKTLSLRPIVEQVIASLEIRLGECQGRIELCGEWPQVLGSQTLLEQIFANLLDNALIYVSEGVAPRVELSCELVGGEAVVCVADNGIGIAPEYQEKVFAIFQRLHPASRYPGTGIGLAMVRKSAELMNGRVRLQSEQGRGSRFFVYLSAAMR